MAAPTRPGPSLLYEPGCPINGPGPELHDHLEQPRTDVDEGTSQVAERRRRRRSTGGGTSSMPVPRPARTMMMPRRRANLRVDRGRVIPGEVCRVEAHSPGTLRP